MIIAFIVFFSVSLFLTYTLSRNDFVLLRKNISITQMFDYFFIFSFLSFFLSRTFFILDEKLYSYFYPLNFLHIFKLPGISIYGFFEGIALLLLILILLKKIVGRVSDIYLISLIPLYFLTFFLRDYGAYALIIYILITLLIIAILALAIKFHNEYFLRDGSISFIVVFLLSLDAFIAGVFIKHESILSIFSFSQIVALISSFIVMSLLFRNQRKS